MHYLAKLISIKYHSQQVSSISYIHLVKTKKLQLILLLLVVLCVVLSCFSSFKVAAGYIQKLGPPDSHFEFRDVVIVKDSFYARGFRNVYTHQNTHAMRIDNNMLWWYDIFFWMNGKRMDEREHKMNNCILHDIIVQSFLWTR